MIDFGYYRTVATDGFQAMHHRYHLAHAYTSRKY